MKRAAALIAAAAAAVCLLRFVRPAEGGKRVERLLLIRSVGIDREGDGVAVTACTGLDPEGAPPRIFLQRGESVSAAVEAMCYNAAGREPFFSHAEHVILGESALREGVSGELDWILRSMEVRMDTDLVVVRGGRAEELITGAAGEGTAAGDMLTLLRERASAAGAGCAFSCGETAASLEERGCALVPAVRVVPSRDLSTGSGAVQAVPAGFAVLREGGLAGYLDPALSLAAALLLDRLETCPLTVETAFGGVTVELDRTARRFLPVFDEGGTLLEVRVCLSADASVLQAEDGADLRREEVRSAVARAVETRLCRDAAALLSRTQALDADVLGVGGALRRAAPGAFDRMPEPWSARFRTVPFVLSAEAELTRSYELERPPAFAGEAGA